MATQLPADAIILAYIRQTETGRKDASAYTTIYGHNEGKLPKPLTTMTVDEVIAAGPGWTKRFKSSAAGAYQFMNATLKDLKASEGLTGKEVFNAALQDRLGLALLKRRGFDGFMAGKLTLTAFGNNLAKEWASFPVLSDIKGAHRQVKRGQTFYAGDKLNKALVKPESVEAVLAEAFAAREAAPIPIHPLPPPERGRSPLIPILVIVLLALLIGGFFFWRF